MHTLFFTTAVHKKGIFFLSLCLFCHLVVNYKHKKKIQSNLQVTLWAMRKKIKIQENKRCNTETYCKTWMSSYCNTVDHFHTQLKTVELETRCSSGCCWATRATINGGKKYMYCFFTGRPPPPVWAFLCHFCLTPTQCDTSAPWKNKSDLVSTVCKNH